MKETDNMHSLNTPAKRIKDAILRLGCKQKDFANNTGIYYTTLSRYLTEKTSIPEHYIHKASEALDLPYEYIKYGNPEGVSLPSYGAKENIQYIQYKEIINRLENIEQLLNTLLEQKEKFKI